MSELISIKDLQRERTAIDVSSLQRNVRQIRSGLINTDVEVASDEVITEHSAEPIKNMDDIMRTSRYLIAQGRYRDNMLFIVGINFGLRVSDLIELRYSSLINPNCTFKDRFPVFEIKTRNTRKHKFNRYITINTAVMEAVTLYLEHTPNVDLNDYLFTGGTNYRPKTGDAKFHITRCTVDRIMKRIAKEMNLNMRVSTHTLRKTFAYHQMVMSHNGPRKLLLLSKMMGHSSINITLDYIGITGEEIDEAYLHLNLGSEEYNYLNSHIGEAEMLSLIG